MGWEDVLLLAVLAIIAGLAALYVYKAKKSGKKCIGCPDSGSCKAAREGASASCGGGCHHCSACHGCPGCTPEGSSPAD